MDVKTNQFGTYVKLAERRYGNRNTVVLPISGLTKLIDILSRARDAAGEGGSSGAASTAAPVGQTVFVKGFAKDTPESDVVAFMSTVGKVANVEAKGQYGSLLVEVLLIA